MKKKILTVIAVVLIAALIPTSLWGISRLQLKKENTNFIKGTWVETDWNEGSTFDPTDEALYHTIDFDSSKDFNLLCLTDIHYRNDGWYGSWAINYQNAQTDKDIKELVKEANPDLIIATGDIETGSLNDKNYENFVKVMDEFEIPWTIVFGNHDAEHRADKPAIMNILQNSKYCVFRQGPTNLGITYDSVVKTGIIHTDKECDMGNHGGTLFKIKYDGNKITIDSNALYTQKRDYKSVRYVRPVEDF